MPDYYGGYVEVTTVTAPSDSHLFSFYILNWKQLHKQVKKDFRRAV